MPRISEETIRRVAEATDIVDLIQAYFPLKRAGALWRALCPFHNEKTPSFTVNPSRQSYKCFGCGAGGTVFRFLMDYEHIEFTEAVRRLASRAGIPVLEDGGSAPDERTSQLRKRLLAANSEAATWFHEQLMKSPAADVAREYLKSRGLSRDIAKNWQLGFAPDSWDALLEHLRSRQFTEPEIAQSGLASSKDNDDPLARAHLYSRFRGRVMFPIRNDYGEVIAFSGRTLSSDAHAAKYVNSPESPIFTKGRVLFGLDKTKRALIAAKSAIVLEGQIDVISAYESGVQNVIAPQGTAFTSDQARLLSRFVESVVLCFDSDRAGQEAITRSLPALLECGLPVRVARLPEGHDPDSLIRSQGAAAFSSLVENAPDFFDHALQRMIEDRIHENPTRMAAATRKLAGFTALVKDPVARDALCSRIGSRLGIAPASFIAQLRSVKPTRADSKHSDAPPSGPPSLVLSEGVALLCRLALLSPEAREFLAAQDDPPIADLGPGSQLLVRILSHHGEFDSPSAISTFSSSLPTELESALAALDLSNPHPDPLPTCHSAWAGLAKDLLLARRDSSQARLRLPNLPDQEYETLLQSILNIERRLEALGFSRTGTPPG